jgi:hypothetical protein
MTKSFSDSDDGDNQGLSGKVNIKQRLCQQNGILMHLQLSIYRKVHQLNDFTPSNLTGLESRNNGNRNQSLLVSGLNFNLNKGIIQ